MNVGVRAMLLLGTRPHTVYCSEGGKKINREEAMRKKRRKKGSGQLQTTGGLEERRRIYLQ